MNKAIIIFWTVAVILVAATLLLILSEMQLVMLERKRKAKRAAAKKAAQPPTQAPPRIIPIAIIPQVVEQTPESEPTPEPKPQKPPRCRRRRGLVDLPAASILGTLVGSVLAGTVAALPFLLKEKNGKGTKKKKHSRRDALRVRSSKRVRLLLR